MLLKSLCMWLLPMLLFAGQFVLRLWPGLMMQDIMQQFCIDASLFGMLSSAYYYGYAGMQIPIAVALEKFGARYVASLGAVIIGLAALLFINTQSWPLALLARFLIGVGSAAGFLSVSQVISEWFSKESYTFMVGLSFTFGLTGAVYGGRPINQLIESYGGYQVWSVVGCLSVLLGVMIFALLRSPQKNSTVQEEIIQLKDLMSLVKYKNVWILAIANLLMVGTLEGFADVWGVNYLMTAFPFAKSTAAQLISFIFVGMLFGGPILAWFSHRFGVYKTIACCGLGMTLSIGGMLFMTAGNLFLLTALFLILGVLSCYQVIVFSAGTQLVEKKMLGITVAFLNCMNMLGGSFFHTTIGKLMDMFWIEGLENGVRQYSLISYQWGLSIIPISALIGVILIIYLTQQKVYK